MRENLGRSFSRRYVLAGLSALAGLVATLGSSFAQRKRGGNLDNRKPGNRIEPLFTSETDARKVMADHCIHGVDNPMTATQVELLVSRLKPQLWLAQHRDGGWLGETRLGGAPDLPKGAIWPMRPVPLDAEKKAEQWKEHHGWIARHVTRELPFEFIGQIDFAELTREQERQFELPTEGRLLFFWDGAVGLIESGAHTCRVIFDETPVADLARVGIPALFAEMEAWWRAPDPKQIEHFKTMARSLDASGQKDAANAMRDAVRKSEKPDPASKKPFVYPPRAKRLVPLWVLPMKNSVELSFDKDLSAFADNDDTSEHYELLTSNDTGPFTSSNMRRTQPWLTIQARLTRMMGPPVPEQDDPRFDAVDKAHIPPHPWNSEQISDAARKASEWQLLLQVSIADLSQKQAEGTVYFMILKSDLAKRDFSRVVASHQQT